MTDAQRMESINRTAAVVLRYALDPVDAADVLIHQLGFDVAFLALAATPTKAGMEAMWAAICCLAFDDAVS